MLIFYIKFLQIKTSNSNDESNDLFIHSINTLKNYLEIILKL